MYLFRRGKMTTLYKLSDEFAAAAANLKSLMDNEEIDKATYADTLESMSGDVEDKCLNVGAHIKNLRAESAAFQEAIKEMQRRHNAIKSELEFYEGYLETHFRKAGLSEVKNNYVEIKFKKLPDIVVIDDEESIPQKYKKEKIVISISKSDLKKDLAINDIKGAHIESDRTSLMIE